MSADTSCGTGERSGVAHAPPHGPPSSDSAGGDGTGGSGSPDRSIGPWAALLWSLVCPGVGEHRAGHRGRGLLVLAAFAVACVWFLVVAYSAMYALSDAVKSRDPTLAERPMDVGQAVVMTVRLFLAIHGEYLAERQNIHRRIAGPLWTILILYVLSMGQAYVLARRGHESPSTARSEHVASR